MCLAKAYSARGDDQELILEDVSKVTVDGDRLSLQSLFGERKEIAGSLMEIDFQRAMIIIKTTA